MQQTLGKEERLKKRKEIEALFKKEKAISESPIRLIWAEMEDKTGKFPLQTGFSVSKRNFKKAVDRNKVKRLMREGFRKNKEGIYSFLGEKDLKYSILLIYTQREIIPYKELEQKIISALSRFEETLKKQMGN